MRAHFLAVAAVVALHAWQADAACVGGNGLPFDCPSGDAMSSADLFMGGETATGKTVKYTAAQLLVFIRSQLPAVPNGTLLGGSAGAFVPIGVGSGLLYSGGTLDIANLISAGSVGGGTILPSITFNVHGEIVNYSTTVLGTAALVNTGTLGSVLGLLNTGNVHSGTNQFTAGVEIGSPTGGMPSAGTVNATALQIGGVPVLTTSTGVTAAGSGIALNGGTVSAIENTNSISTAPYTLQASDQAGLVEITSAGPTIVVQPGSLGAKFFTDIFVAPGGFNIGTITLATGTIVGYGGTKFYLAANTHAKLVIPDGTNAAIFPSSPFTPTSGYNLTYNYGINLQGVSTNTLPSLGQNFVAGANINLGTLLASDNLVVGFNQTSTSSPVGMVVGGNGQTFNGAFNSMSGQNGNDWGAKGGYYLGSDARGQGGTWEISGHGSGTGAIRLLIGGSSGSTGSIPAQSALGFTEIVTCYDRAANASATWFVSNSGGAPALLSQTTTAVASTTIAAGVTFAPGGTLGTFISLGTWSLVGDTTNGGFNEQYTPGVSNVGTVDCSGHIFWNWAS